MKYLLGLVTLPVIMYLAWYTLRGRRLSVQTRAARRAMARVDLSPRCWGDDWGDWPSYPKQNWTKENW